MADDMGVAKVSGVQSSVAKAQQTAMLRKQYVQSIMQEASKVAFQEFAEQALFGPAFMNRRFEPLEKKFGKREKEPTANSTSETLVETPVELDDIEMLAEQIQEANEELLAKDLLKAKGSLKGETSPKQYLDKVLSIFRERALADEALEFIEKTSVGAEKAVVKQARELLAKQHGVEVRAGRNMGLEARAFAKAGLANPKELRGLYTEIINHPKSAIDLFAELKEKFSYDKMKQALEFVLNSIGRDVAAKGSSIEKAELIKLLSECRNMQAILMIYKFFQGRMKAITLAFRQMGFFVPASLNFESMALAYMTLIKSRHVSAVTVRQSAPSLGIAGELPAQSYLFGHFREAVKHTSPKLFRNPSHTEELFLAIIEAIDEIDDEVDEEFEKKEQAEKEQQ